MKFVPLHRLAPLILACAVLAFGAPCDVQANTSIFNAGEKGVFQILLAHARTREKAVIGSGFIFGTPHFWLGRRRGG
ncbi:MAG: hypothetical protein ACI8PT_000562 [Gammaproteobacteria bacterium]|jgi:hypothetical protein